MGYIIKDTAALLTTKLTDAARRKMSEGTFNISYFQIGDSEVCYDCIDGEILSNGMVLDSEYNAKSLSPIPEKNQANVKYPIYTDSNSTNTFGIPVKSSYIDNIFNTAAPRGFFATGSTSDFNRVIYTSGFTKNPNWVSDISNINSGQTLTLTYNELSASVNGQTEVGDFVTIYYESVGSLSAITNNYPILTYKVLSVTGDTSGSTGTVYLQLDRDLPRYGTEGYTGLTRTMIYPSGMTELYDTFTPEFYWNQDAIDFESNCDVSNTDVKIWNMNIPWTESPAGVFTTTHQGFTNYDSKKYVGTKEYLGYNTNSGQIDSGGTYYYNSFSEKINLSPSNQKSIAIVHYTNQSIDNLYGEKFALQPYDSLYPNNTGQARNFKIHIPWLMWHKSDNSEIGETFYVDPPGFDSLNLFTVHYLKSNVNSNMNNPGLRYYHLWDTNVNSNGYPNRVGKVWPDLKIITFDDDEIIAALSYKSNRNWTLPAPKLGLIVPNSFDGNVSGGEGILSGSSESLWVTYRFNSIADTNSLHCNYYTLITGTDPECPPDSADVTFRLGDEFPFMMGDNTTTYVSGFNANEISILVQKVATGLKPSPEAWYEIDVTNQMSAYTENNFITVDGLKKTTFLITKTDFDNAVSSGNKYRLNNYIDIPQQGDTGATLNFGGEYFFYGTIQTDIQATIYVMNYLCNLGSTQFLNSSNPTWNDTDSVYVSEIGLYDDEKNLMIITKVQSPEKRLGVQQYSIKFDF